MPQALSPPLHHIPNGEVWTVDEILKRKAIIEQAGPVWSVVESVPIHEDIKTRSGNYLQWIANYQQSLRNRLSAVFVPCATTSCRFSTGPVPTSEYVLPDGSKALRFDQIEFAAFELHILQTSGRGSGLHRRRDCSGK